MELVREELGIPRGPGPWWRQWEGTLHTARQAPPLANPVKEDTIAFRLCPQYLCHLIVFSRHQSSSSSACVLTDKETEARRSKGYHIPVLTSRAGTGQGAGTGDCSCHSECVNAMFGMSLHGDPDEQIPNSQSGVLGPRVTHGPSARLRGKACPLAPSSAKGCCWCASPEAICWGTRVPARQGHAAHSHRLHLFC